MPNKVNIVLVHGAWADGSSWSAVITRLQKENYHVTAVQLPLSSLAEDVARVRQVLEMQDGPTLLAGHSYAGAVITQLGKDAPNVVGLVYVAAFAPDEGETPRELAGAEPQPPGAQAFRTDAQGYIWLDREGFMQFFAPDVKQDWAMVLSAVQKPIGASSLLSDEQFVEPAWKSLPSWYLVSEDDKMIPPDAQRLMAKRAGAKISTVASSHVPMISQPDAVAKLIMDAANSVK